MGNLWFESMGRRSEEFWRGLSILLPDFLNLYLMAHVNVSQASKGSVGRPLGTLGGSPGMGCGKTLKDFTLCSFGRQ